MKRILLSTLALCVLALSFNAQTVVLSEDFDSFTAGDGLAASSADFETWSGGAADDAPITDALANSGSNSVLFESTAATGGPADIMLPLGYTSGAYEVSFDIRIASDSGAYFNIQETTDPGDAWVTDVFLVDGSMEIVNDPGGSADLEGVADYTSDNWHNVTLVVNMDADLISFSLDGTAIVTYTSTGNLGGINFFAYGGGAPVIGKYYIDNVTVTNITGLGVEAEKLELNQLTLLPNPSDDALTVDLGADVSNAHIDVISLTGSLVRSADIVNASLHAFDVRDLQSGIYFVRVMHNGNVLTRRLVIK